MKRYPGRLHQHLPSHTDSELFSQSNDGLEYVALKSEGTATQHQSRPSLGTVTTESGGLSVTRSVVVEDDEFVFDYVVSSERPQRVRFHLRDTVPSLQPAAVAGTHPDDPYTVVDTTWWVDADEQLEFRRRVPESSRAALPPTDQGITDLRPELSVIEPEHRVPRNSDDDVSGADVTGGQTGNGTALESATEKSSVLVALPAYNEARSISTVVANAKRYADAVLVVDDGSDDETASRAWEAGAFVAEHGANKGYGVALRTIFAAGVEVGANHVVVLDSDGQHQPADIPRFVAKQRASDADLVVGNRFGEGAETDLPRYRWFGLTVINVLTNIAIGRGLTGSNIRDTQSGFRAYSARAVRSLLADERLGERMEVSTDILYHAEQQGYDVAEVSTTIAYDVEGASSLNPVYHGYLLVRNLVPIIGRERPLFVLGMLSLLLAVFGTAAQLLFLGGSSPVGSVEPPGPVVLTGALVCVTGVTLHTLRRVYSRKK